MYFANANGTKVEPEHCGIQHEAIESAHDTVFFEGRHRPNQIDLHR